MIKYAKQIPLAGRGGVVVLIRASFAVAVGQMKGREGGGRKEEGAKNMMEMVCRLQTLIHSKLVCIFQPV